MVSFLDLRLACISRDFEDLCDGQYEYDVTEASGDLSDYTGLCLLARLPLSAVRSKLVTGEDIPTDSSSVFLRVRHKVHGYRCCLAVTNRHG